MHGRCRTVKHRSHRDYGGRGIKVCARWQRFEAFFEDMGHAPDGLSLDRIDNNGNYEPSNCRWATWSEQLRNTRRAVFIEINGEKRHAREIEESLGLSKGALWHRLKSGWSIEKACSTPRISR